MSDEKRPAHDTLAELRGVTKSFVEGGQRQTIVANFSVSVARGRITVLRGPSGSGKTTLLNLICGIEVPDSGEVRIAGRTLAGMSDYDRTWLRRSRIGFIFQFFNLVPTLSVLENVRLPLELNGMAVRRADPRARRWLERVGLSRRARARPDALSGGEQQRVAIARALVHEPDLVLADEPTGNLDSVTAARVLALLAGLVREQARTLVMATHSDAAAALADTVVDLGSPARADADA